MKIRESKMEQAIELIEVELDRLTEEEYNTLANKGMSTDVALSYTRGIINIAGRNGLLIRA